MFVYFIQSGKRGAIKIGIARNIERRMSVLQTGNQYQLHLIAKVECSSRKHAEKLEKQFHKIFHKQRIRGEWFQGNIRLARIKSIALDLEQEAEEMLDRQMLNEIYKNKPL